VKAVTANDRDASLVVEALQGRHAAVQREVVGDLQVLALTQGELRSVGAVERLRIRNHRVEAVVAALELDDEQDAICWNGGLRLDDPAEGEARGHEARPDERDAARDELSAIDHETSGGGGDWELGLIVPNTRPLTPIPQC
jgi:hypothetical protein